MARGLRGAPDGHRPDWVIPRHETSTLAERSTRHCLVIPVIDEGERLLRQLGRLKELERLPDVVVADGGSADGSTDTDRLRSLGVRTLLVKQDRGRLSAQLRMAMAYAITEGYDGVITMDGNGKDDPEGVQRFVEALDSGVGYVQGSRFVAGGVAENTPRERLLAIKMLHAPITSLAARKRFTDTTNGFRGHSRALLTDPRVAPFRDVFDSYELLAYLPIRAARLGYSCAEVPVTRRYPSSGLTPTKIHGRGAQLELVRILLRAATGVYDPPSGSAGRGPSATGAPPA